MKLSVITINYNNAEGLAKTMDSVFRQRFSDFEYIFPGLRQLEAVLLEQVEVDSKLDGDNFQGKSDQNALLDVDAVLDVGLVACDQLLELSVVDGVQILDPAGDDPVGRAGVGVDQIIERAALHQRAGIVGVVVDVRDDLDLNALFLTGGLVPVGDLSLQRVQVSADGAVVGDDFDVAGSGGVFGLFFGLFFGFGFFRGGVCRGLVICRLIRRRAGSTCSKGEDHDRGQKQSDKFFHCFSSLLFFVCYSKFNSFSEVRQSLWSVLHNPDNIHAQKLCRMLFHVKIIMKYDKTNRLPHGTKTKKLIQNMGKTRI